VAAATLLAIGCFTILGQVVLLRELAVAFYGSELIYTLALAGWLLGGALGAVTGRWTHRPSEARVRLGLLAFAVLVPAELVFTRLVRQLFHGIPGAYLPLPDQLAGMALATLPLAILSGLLFQWAAKRWIDARRTLVGAYAIESAGGLVGGTLATLLLRWSVPTLATGLLCAGCCALAAALRWGRAPGRRIAAASLLLAAGLLTGAAASGPLDAWLTAQNHPDLLDSFDTPYGRLTVTRRLGQEVVYVNDARACEAEGTGAEERVELAALQVASPRRLLALGGSVEGLVGQALRHAPDRVDVVELSAALPELLSRRLDPAARRALDDRRSRLVIADPRAFLASAGTYDVVLIAMPQPDSGQANRFYTRDFFSEAAGHLAADGVLALRLPSAENLWSPQLAHRAASIDAALRAVFADVLVLPGTTNVILAGRRLVRDPAELADRFRARGLTARLVSPAYLDYLYTNDRLPEIAGLLAAADVRPNTDEHPVCYQATQLLWLSRLLPSLALGEVVDLSPLAHPGLMAGGGAALLLLLLCARLLPGPRTAALAFLAGLAGLLLETTLILHYQVKEGVLFQDLGLLLTLFMAGLACGALAADRAIRRAGGLREVPRRYGLVSVALLAALALVAALAIRAGVAGLLPTGLMLATAGASVAAVFAWASTLGAGDPRAAVSPLYGADLLGGCAGSLLASLWLVPTVGLAGCALAVVVLAVAALVLA